jgi:phosphoserine phosphatase
MPLLLEVDKPVAVDPDEALNAEATSRGWDIISLRE